jgi:hypothetical protein
MAPTAANVGQMLSVGVCRSAPPQSHTPFFECKFIRLVLPQGEASRSEFPVDWECGVVDSSDYSVILDAPILFYY